MLWTNKRLIIGVGIALMIVIGGLAISVGNSEEGEYTPIYASEDAPDLTNESGAYRSFGSNGRNVEQIENGNTIVNTTDAGDLRIRTPTNSTPNSSCQSG